MLPDDLRDLVKVSTLLVGSGHAPAGDAELPAIRRAIREERKLYIRYIDREGSATRRTIWPFALGFFDRARVAAAWCELRKAYRHFRTDRIVALTATEARYPPRRQALLREWRASEGIPVGRGNSLLT